MSKIQKTWDAVEFKASTCKDRLSHLRSPKLVSFQSKVLRTRLVPLETNPSRGNTRGVGHAFQKIQSKGSGGQACWFSAERCMEIHFRGDFFSLEGRSIALHLDSWKRLMGLPGVFVVYYHNCIFRGSRRRKYQIMIVNSA